MKSKMMFVMFLVCMVAVPAFASEPASVGDAMIKAIGGIEAVAAKVEQMAPVVWDALVYDKVFDGIAFLSVFCFGLMIAVVLVKLCVLLLRKYDTSDSDFELIVAITCGVFAAIAAICLTVAAFNIPEAIRNIVRPDVGVIVDLVNAVGRAI